MYFMKIAQAIYLLSTVISISGSNSLVAISRHLNATHWETCGGVLVSAKWVLTYESCKGSNVAFSVGAFHAVIASGQRSLNKSPKRLIITWITHPTYNSDLMGEHNLALAELEYKFSTHVIKSMAVNSDIFNGVSGAAGRCELFYFLHKYVSSDGPSFGVGNRSVELMSRTRCGRITNESIGLEEICASWPDAANKSCETVNALLELRGMPFALFSRQLEGHSNVTVFTRIDKYGDFVRAIVPAAYRRPDLFSSSSQSPVYSKFGWFFTLFGRFVFFAWPAFRFS